MSLSMPAKLKPEASAADPRRRVTSVSTLLEQPAIKELIAVFSRPLVLDAIHEAQAQLRARIKDAPEALASDALLNEVQSILARQQSARLRPVVNATGIILHTGLGRAVLPQRAVDALAGLNRCCNLQIDLDTGLRGKRNFMCSALLAKLTGAEAATIVNNNAAATFLLLSALCQGKEVIISRGQLIEIGGSFRLPDCIHQSGAKMVEVGTTNKTHLRDYEQAVTTDTGMILRVNPSNYRVVGFSQDVPIADLVALKKKKPLFGPVLVVDDLGCGALVNLEKYGLPKEPTVQESIAAGADLVCFSGDKLIGGPQAGIILGRKDLIERIKKHPLSRMLRVGKLTDLALEQTLRLFLDPDSLVEHNPTLRMLAASPESLKQKAQELKGQLEQAQVTLEARVTESASATGGGSLPAVDLPTFVLALRSARLTPDQLSQRLRQNKPPIIARITGDEVHLDMRTLLAGDEAFIVQALKRITNL
jgi:L-seryl-tRNA(Ser) seleniumtransferase